MSKWIDNDIKKHVQEKIHTIIIGRTEIEDAEINTIMPQVRDHYKQHFNDSEIFYEEKTKSHYILLVIDRPLFTPKLNKENNTYRLWGKCKLGAIGVFLEPAPIKTIKEVVGWGNEFWARGKISTKFSISGCEIKFCKSIEEACERNGIDIKSIKEDADIIKSYTFNLWQVIV